MTRRVVWSKKALKGFEAQIAYVARDDKRSATLVANRLETAVNALRKAASGRFGRVAGTYEKSVQKTSFIIAFELTETEIRILRVIHSARDWKQGQWPDA